jgi:hypothetical protein
MLQTYWPQPKHSRNSFRRRAARTIRIGGYTLLLCATAQPLYAGTASGRITHIELSNNSNAVLFSTSSAIDKTPRCNTLGLFALDLTQTGGPAMYELLLDARQYGYVLTVTGLNICTVYLEAEAVKKIVLE